MSALRSSFPFLRRLFGPSSISSRRVMSLRFLTINSQLNSYREVQEYEDGDTLVVEGVQRDRPGSSQLTKSQTSCPICSRNLEVKYTDVLILEQFVSKKGDILPMEITGVCGRQHGRLKLCIEMAQKAGLLPPPDLEGYQPPPEWMRIPRGSFHIFYNNKRKDYKEENRNDR